MDVVAQIQHSELFCPFWQGSSGNNHEAYIHFLILHCSKSESGCTLAKSSTPSCKDLNCVFLSAYSVQKPLLLHISLISLSNRHYMFLVTVLCHTLSFNCFSYLAVASTLLFFLFFSFISGYTVFCHIYFVNDSFDPGSNFWLLSCLCSSLLCPSLSEIALIFLLERFHVTTAAAVVLFLLYIFLDLNSSNGQEPFILHIFLCLSLKLFHEIPLHHFQFVSYFLQKISPCLCLRNNLSLFPWFNSAHLDEL